MPLVSISIDKRDLLFRIAEKEKKLLSPEIKRLIGTTFKQLIRDGFDREQDPYGNPWAPIQRDGRILNLTGALRGSFRAKNAADEVTVGTNVFYAPFHQQGSTSRIRARVQPASKRTGRFTKSRSASSRLVRVPRATRRVVRRPFLPDSRGMPPRWRKAVRDAIRQFTATI